MTATDGARATLRRAALVLGSLLVTLLLVEGALRVGGWWLTRDLRRANAAPVPGEAIRVLCLGESTTQNGPRPWPEQLEEVLEERFPGRSFRVFNGGVGGTTTALIVGRLESQIEEYRPHAVVTMMGINDRLFGARLRFDDGSPGLLASLRLARVARMAVDALGGAEEPRPVRPGAWRDRILEADHRANLGHLEEAAAVFQAAHDAGVRSPDAEWRLAVLHQDRGELERALPFFERAISLAPDRIVPRAGRVELLRALGRADEADRAAAELERLSAVAPRVDELRLRAVEELRGPRSDLAAATETLREAAALLPERLDLLLDLGRLLEAGGRDAEARGLRERIEARAPGALDDFRRMAWPYVPASVAGPQPPAPPEGFVGPAATRGRVQLHIELAHHCLAIDEPELAAWSVATALALDPASEVFLLDLGMVLIALDSPPEDIQRIYAALGYAVQGSLGREQALDVETTRANYRRLDEILVEHGIAHVAMQYATLPLADLEMMLPEDTGATFVSNEDNFVRALAEHGYDALFVDRLGNTFGHATARGNRLLAERAADGVIEALGLEPRTPRAPPETP